MSKVQTKTSILGLILLLFALACGTPDPEAPQTNYRHPLLSKHTDLYKADYYFKLGNTFLEKEKNAVAIAAFYAAQALYPKAYLPKHIRFAHLYGRLALAHRFSNHMDTALLYIDKAMEVVQMDSAYLEHCKEILLLKSQFCWNEREYDEGIFLVNQVLNQVNREERPDSLLIARCLSLRGRHYSKQLKDSLALTSFITAIEIARREGNKKASQELYEYLLSHCAQRGDSLNFYHYVVELEELFPDKDSLKYVFPERLRAYYYYRRKEYQKAVPLYQRFYAYYQGRSEQNFETLYHIYYVLSKSYEQMGIFDSAEYFIIKSLANGTGLDSEYLTWQQTLASPIANKDFVFVSYDRLGSIFLQHYEQDPSRKDLLYRALDVYSLVDSIIFLNMNTVNNEAVLTFLNDYGALYSRALKVVHYLYQQTPTLSLLQHANVFIDRLKTPVMFRDFIAEDKALSTSIPDELLATEQQINQQLKALELGISQGRQTTTEQAAWLALNQQRQALYKTFQQQYPDYFFAKLNQQIISIDSLQKRLAPQQKTILQYYLGEEDFYLLVISADTCLFFKTTKRRRSPN